jgi:hypothetical protein
MPPRRLTTLVASTGVATTGRISRRYTSLGYSDYFYVDGTDWLPRENVAHRVTGEIPAILRTSIFGSSPEVVIDARYWGLLQKVVEFPIR